MRRMRGVVIRATMIGPMALAAVGAAGSGSATAAVPPSFAGSCALHGAATLSHPVTSGASDSGVGLAARGRCSGTLDGTGVIRHGAALTLDGSGPVSCGGSGSLPVTGTLSVSNIAIPVHGTVTIAGRRLAFTLLGNDGGAASGHGRFRIGHRRRRAARRCFVPRGASVGAIQERLTVSSTLLGARPVVVRPTPQPVVRTRPKPRRVVVVKRRPKPVVVVKVRPRPVVVVKPRPKRVVVRVRPKRVRR